MSNDIPAWVTALSIVLGFVIFAVVTGIIVGNIAGRVLGRVFTRRTKTGLLELDDLIAGKHQEIKSLEDIRREAFEMVKTVEAFELNESIPLKLRQIAAVLRVGQLKHRYETATLGLTHTQDRLLAARRSYASYGGSLDTVKRLEAFANDQEAKIAQMEPLLEQWGITVERLTTRLHAV